MYRFLLRPRWLIAHVVVAALAMLLVNLGLWQLSRHEERTALNARVAERLEAPAQPLERVARPAAGGDDLAYRRVRVTGEYLVDEEVLLSPRPHNGRPGHHVLTPLASDGDRVVFVDRGWVPFEHDTPPVSEAAPPDGPVEVSGFLRPTEPPERLAPDLPEGELDRVSRVDLERLDAQVDGTPYPYYLQLEEQRPGRTGSLPVPAELPDVTDDGNHFSYAIQWFSFAAVGLVGYPLVIRRAARDRDG